jgi:Histidinol dehydrogenase
MRILSGDAASRRVRKLELRSSDFAIVEPKVRNIVDDVRRRGDRALREYAAQWDGLEAKHSRLRSCVARCNRQPEISGDSASGSGHGSGLDTPLEFRPASWCGPSHRWVATFRAEGIPWCRRC